ncbi:MAG: glycosyltransferase family 4 protein [Myxococcales bacterium]|nr:MAG: glycosyltransferase family 4 protein [Myxococcales bacterium]
MILHVACLPFPSHQGTQAAIAAMLGASAQNGRPAHLLVYAHGAYALDAPYEIHRIGDFPRVRSLRSGPSWAKIALDARCIAETRKLARRLRPQAIIAHHVEAALAALAADVGPVYYIAHTSLSAELPIYFPRLPTWPLSATGGALERYVCRRAERVAAVAPSLAAILGSDTVYLPVPWARQSPGPARNVARAALSLPRDVPVCLYAGNLDRYQGWETLIEAIAELRQTEPGARLLVATESDPAPARRDAAGRGVAEALEIRRLDSERARALVHGASDVAWIPRRTQGGLPIKMLDVFARGVPVIAMERATAGLPVERACHVVPDQDAHALRRATEALLGEPKAREALRAEAFRYLASHHSTSAYVTALRALLDSQAITPREATPHAPRRRAERGFQAR